MYLDYQCGFHLWFEFNENKRTDRDLPDKSPLLVMCSLFSRYSGLRLLRMRLSLVPCFSALSTGYIFSRAFDWLHVVCHYSLHTISGFPAFATNVCNSYIIAGANSWLPVDPCLSLANKCFLRFAPKVFVSCFDWLFFFSRALYLIAFSSEIKLRPILTFSCIFY